MSTFEVPVVPVRLEPHPNADTLSLVRVFGYQVVVRTADWRGEELGAYIPPDSVVPDAPEYAFLGQGEEKPDGSRALRDKDRRITVKKLRGERSEGLLMPAPVGARIGDNVAAQLGITHYEPPVRDGGTYGAAEKAPFGIFPVYDLEHHKRHGDALIPGELVVISEKLHGANAKYAFRDGRMYVGSRNQWKRDEPGSAYWKVLRKYPQIERLCRANPDLTIYGEVYGDVQDLKYGAEKGEVFFAAFDLYRDGNPQGGIVRRQFDKLALRLGYQRIPKAGGWVDYVSARDLCDSFAVPWVPVFSVAPYDPEQSLRFTDGKSVIPGADHVREGCVIRPIVERHDPRVGRVHLKNVSGDYLSRSETVLEVAA